MGFGNVILFYEIYKSRQKLSQRNNKQSRFLETFSVHTESSPENWVKHRSTSSTPVSGAVTMPQRCGAGKETVDWTDEQTAHAQQPLLWAGSAVLGEAGL